MSLLLTIIGVVIAAVFLILLSLGLFVALGIVLIVGVMLAIIGVIFGGLSWSTFTTGTQGDDASLAVPQKFNACLLGDDLDLCRRKFTHWDAKDIELVQQLSKQVKEELGERDATTSVQHFESNSVNGHRTVTIDQETDFAKRKNVHEHYVLSEDDKDDENPLKIKDLKWDY